MEKIAADLLLKGLAPEGFADGQPIGLVTTDSREVCPGCIFVAFPGERFDGHDFAAKALEEGAAYTLTTGLESEKITMSSLVYSEGQSMQGPGQGGPRMDGQNGQP